MWAAGKSGRGYTIRKGLGTSALGEYKLKQIENKDI